MYMQEALELVCRRRKLANPADWALLLIDNTRTNKRKILIPLDRTVASLQGKRELLLVSRAMIPFMDVEMLKGSSRTTDPNGEDVPFYSSALLLTPRPLSIHFYKEHRRRPGPPNLVRLGLQISIQGLWQHCRRMFFGPSNHINQKYTIYRKMPMLVARQERTLAIDGVYIHVSHLKNALIHFAYASIAVDHACCEQGQGCLR